MEDRPPIPSGRADDAIRVASDAGRGGGGLQVPINTAPAIGAIRAERAHAKFRSGAAIVTIAIGRQAITIVARILTGRFKVERLRIAVAPAIGTDRIAA